jgi:Flp pilus assembly protein TadG
MDANGELKSLRKKLNNKGIAVVYLAILMIVLVGFVGLAVDIGYMYVAKGQLQNAADAAALAGAALLDGSNSTTQTAARDEAVKFALANTATGVPVTIANDYSNMLSNIATDGGNDITVGNWDPTQTPKYSTARTPVNALQVRARRTVSANSSAQRMVDVFFAKAFGWQKMAAAASAIANANRFATGLVLCQNSCGLSGTFYLNDNSQIDTSTAWTVFDTDSNVSSSRINNLINGKVKIASDMCGQCVTDTNGTTTNNVNDLAANFSSTTFDAANKTIVSGVVTEWRVLSPILNDDPTCNPKIAAVGTACPPYRQGGPNEPYHIIGWSRIKITGIVNSTGTKGFTASDVQCAFCGAGGSPFTTLGLPATAALVQ